VTLTQRKGGILLQVRDAMYVGIKLLSGIAYSFHVLDYDAYSPSDPSSDAVR